MGKWRLLLAPWVLLFWGVVGLALAIRRISAEEAEELFSQIPVRVLGERNLIWLLGSLRRVEVNLAKKWYEHPLLGPLYPKRLGEVVANYRSVRDRMEIGKG